MLSATSLQEPLSCTLVARSPQDEDAIQKSKTTTRSGCNSLLDCFGTKRLAVTGSYNGTALGLTMIVLATSFA